MSCADTESHCNDIALYDITMRLHSTVQHQALKAEEINVKNKADAELSWEGLEFEAFNTTSQRQPTKSCMFFVRTKAQNPFQKYSLHS